MPFTPAFKVTIAILTVIAIFEAIVLGMFWL
jgi:hypothetical protein